MGVCGAYHALCLQPTNPTHQDAQQRAAEAAAAAAAQSTAAQSAAPKPAWGGAATQGSQANALRAPSLVEIQQEEAARLPPVCCACLCLSVCACVCVCAGMYAVVPGPFAVDKVRIHVYCGDAVDAVGMDTYAVPGFCKTM